MPDKNEVETLQELICRGGGPIVIAEGAEPFILLPPGYTAHAVQHTLPQPTRKRGNPLFTRAESFCDYVNDQKSAASRLYVIGPTQVVCVLNHHACDETAGWGDHRAVFMLNQTPEWVFWKSSNNARKSQRDFAQLIEDHAEDISDPAGADLLDLVRTIKTSQNLEVTGEISDKDLDWASGFIIQTKTKAGAKQDLELPSEFGLRIAPYEGGVVVPVRARLRLEPIGGKLALWYELVRIDRVERTALEQIVATIATDVEMECWYGQP